MRACPRLTDAWAYRGRGKLPFCGDRGPGKHHLSLNTDTDRYNCNLCAAHGNSLTLYAKVKGLTNTEAYRELRRGGNVYPLPRQPVPQNTERQPLPLEARHAAYTDMLSFLTLTERHRENLLERGLSDERIARNLYRSMPETPEARRLLARLVGFNHELLGIPGFYTRDNEWTVAGPNGFLIPVRNKDGLIQGLKIRLDDETNPSRKYRWLSSRDKHLTNGTRGYSWVHVTGNVQSKRAFITEGPLKGDAASFLSDDSLFVCVGGVNAIGGLRETLVSLGVTEAVEAMDMDQMTNPQVRSAVLALRKEVQRIQGVKYSKYTWNPVHKGVDDYLLNRVAGA